MATCCGIIVFTVWELIGALANERSFPLSLRPPQKCRVLTPLLLLLARSHRGGPRRACDERLDRARHRGHAVHPRRSGRWPVDGESPLPLTLSPTFATDPPSSLFLLRFAPERARPSRTAPTFSPRTARPPTPPSPRPGRTSSASSRAFPTKFRAPAAGSSPRTTSAPPSATRRRSRRTTAPSPWAPPTPRTTGSSSRAREASWPAFAAWASSTSWRSPRTDQAGAGPRGAPTSSSLSKSPPESAPSASSSVC